MSKYIPVEVEKKAREKWRKLGLYKVDLDKEKSKYYMLVEFTYPSGDLHMGHWFTFAVPDILARKKKMEGFEVFAPNGFDAFGLPAENAAIKRGIHPKDWTSDNIERMKKQFESMGASYDWEHEVVTSDPDYYRWNQWIFLKMLEKGLAYRGKVLSNWCPKDKTVLANENVEAGKCWRCGTEVVQKEVEQWFFKITEYAEKLLWKGGGPASQAKRGEQRDRVGEDIKGGNYANWPKAVKDAQNNWIGKSEGIEIEFRIGTEGQGDKVGKDVKLKDGKISVFTKFPETIFGVTYMVLAPEHELIASLLKSKVKSQKSKVAEMAAYVDRSRKKTELERTGLQKGKTGVFTGAYCINPVNSQKVPIWISDYVIATYGTGAVMGVPGSDERDFAFAKKFGLPIVRVIGKKKGDQSEVKTREDVLEEGYLVNSGQFDTLVTPDPAKEKIMDFLEEKGWGKRKVNWHLHDWSISRQRYWGTPIPIIYCRNCARGSVSSFPPTSAPPPLYSEVKNSDGGRSSKRGGVRANGTPSRTATPRTTEIDGKEHAIIPVPEKDLPVELPYEVDFAPKGKPPLATAEGWVNVKCPNCGKPAKREVETMDTFVDSSWYFLRYLRDPIFSGPVTSFPPASARSDHKKEVGGIDNPDLRAVGGPSTGATRKNLGNQPWDENYVKAWMPVDIYFGGAEHTLGHTLYSRFFVKFLQDEGYLPDFGEYAQKRVHHGVILGPDGSRMSKSRGNVVNPDLQVNTYGADAVRVYLAFLGPYDLVTAWNPGGIGGAFNFLQRVWKLAEIVQEKGQRDKGPFDKSQGETKGIEGIEDVEVEKADMLPNDDLLIMHKTIKKVGEDIENIKFNTAVSALMEWLNFLERKIKGIVNSEKGKVLENKKTVNHGPLTMNEIRTFLLLLAPFAPHMTEELWQLVHSSQLIVDSKRKMNHEPRTTNHELKYSSIHLEKWPEFDSKLATSDKVTLVVQVNGKLRDKLEIDRGLSKQEALEKARSLANVAKYLASGKISAEIFVPDKLVNFVVVDL